MTDVGVPGTPDGPPLPRKQIGEIAVTFFDSGRPYVKFFRTPGRTRQVIEEAIEELRLLLDGDMLEKLDGPTPREPPL